MTILKKLWEGWKRFGLFIGNIVSTIVLTVFYFTVFLIFAVLFKIFSAGFTSALIGIKLNTKDKNTDIRR